MAVVLEDGIGDGYLTQITAIPGGGAANRVTQQAFDWRGRLVAVKAGVEATESTATNRPIYYYEYDNLNQTIAQEQYDGDTLAITTDSNSDGVPDKPSSTYRRARSESEYDERGRVFRTHVYCVSQTDGTLSTDTLDSDSFYDLRGQLIKTAAPGGLVQKMTYDGAGRMVVTYTTDGGGDSSWTDADDVTGDHVFEQSEDEYDANGNVILVISKQHFHDDTNTGALGDVDTTPYARVSYVAYYYDIGQRLTDVVSVGTNGGTTYTRPGTVPSRSDTVLINSYTYNDAGRTEDTTDPRGIVTRTEYDNLGRSVRTIEAYTDGTPSAADDRTMEYAYDGNGHTLTVTAVLPASAIQETRYVYASRQTDGSLLNSNDLLSAVQHPDPDDGEASGSEEDLYTTNALGETVTYTDRNGTEHTYSYDVVGRLTSDTIAELGSGVDGSVRRLETAYDTVGRPYLFTSYDAASSGNIVNQVQRAFNCLGQLTAEYQEHDGAVNTSTSEKVQYAYSEMAGGANHSRLVGMTYPDGRVLEYQYDSGLDNNVSRPSAIVDDDDTVLEEYSYLGVGTVVVRAHPEPGIDLTYVQVDGDTDFNDDGGDPYTGFDRFGRLIDPFYADGSGDPVDRVQYGYDRNGNVVSKTNLLYTDFNEAFTYDNLNQLTAWVRADGFDQSWDIDARGNFDEVDTDGTPESRTHNAQNELTDMGAAALTYDANGNLTTDENGNIEIYDAWNRLVEVQDDQEQTLVRYELDSFGRTIERTADATTTDLYYGAGGQVVEEQLDGDTAVQNVWTSEADNLLILRDRDTDANGTLDERLYAMQDLGGSVTGLVTTGGSVAERMVYTPYGEVSFREDDWDAKGSSAYEWSLLYKGRKLDGETNQYDFGGGVWYAAKRARANQPKAGAGMGGNAFLFQAANPVARTRTIYGENDGGRTIYEYGLNYRFPDQPPDNRIPGRFTVGINTTIRRYDRAGQRTLGPNQADQPGIFIAYEGLDSANVDFIQFYYVEVWVHRGNGLLNAWYDETQFPYLDGLAEQRRANGDKVPINVGSWQPDLYLPNNPFVIASGAGIRAGGSARMFDEPTARIQLAMNVRDFYLAGARPRASDVRAIRVVFTFDAYAVRIDNNNVGTPFARFTWKSWTEWNKSDYDAFPSENTLVYAGHDLGTRLPAQIGTLPPNLQRRIRLP